MTNRAGRRSSRGGSGLRSKGRPAGRQRHAGRNLLVIVAIAALMILAVASTQLAAQPVVTPTPTQTF